MYLLFTVVSPLTMRSCWLLPRLFSALLSSGLILLFLCLLLFLWLLGCNYFYFLLLHHVSLICTVKTLHLLQGAAVAVAAVDVLQSPPPCSESVKKTIQYNKYIGFVKIKIFSFRNFFCICFLTNIQTNMQTYKYWTPYIHSLCSHTAAHHQQVHHHYYCAAAYTTTYLYLHPSCKVQTIQPSQIKLLSTLFSCPHYLVHTITSELYTLF